MQAHKPRTAQCIPIQNSPGQATATGAMQARNRWPQPHPNGYFRGGGQQGLKYYGDLLAKRDSASPADREGSSLGLWWWGGGAALRKAYRQSTRLVWAAVLCWVLVLALQPVAVAGDLLRRSWNRPFFSYFPMHSLCTRGSGQWAATEYPTMVGRSNLEQHHLPALPGQCVTEVVPLYPGDPGG